MSAVRRMGCAEISIDYVAVDIQRVARATVDDTWSGLKFIYRLADR